MNGLKKRTRPTVECLEARDCPAPLNVTLDPAGNVRITGRAAGDLTITAVGPDMYQIDDTAFATVVEAPGNMLIALLPTLPFSTQGIEIDLGGQTLSGNLIIRGATSEETVYIHDGTIAGNVSLSGIGSFNIPDTLIENTNLEANLTVNNGLGVPLDPFGSSSELFLLDSPVAANLIVRGGTEDNTIDLSGSPVGGSVILNLGRGATLVTLNSTSPVGGNFIYSGGDGANPEGEQVFLDSVINGAASVRFGSQFSNELQFSADAAVLKNFTTTGRNGPVNVNVFDGVVGGNVLFVFGNGDNNLGGDPMIGGSPVNATVLGSQFAVFTGNGDNQFYLGPNFTAVGALLNMRFGNGDNLLSLDSNAFRRGRVFAGNGFNSFVSTVTLNMPFQLINFP